MTNPKPGMQVSFGSWLLAGVVACFAFWGCTQERQPCLTPKTASLNMEFVHYATDSATTTIDTALPMAIFGAITAPDTVKYTLYKSPSANFTISLSPDADSCSWLVFTDSFYVRPDTISFKYQRKLQFLSNACGFTYFYSLSSVQTTHKSIDSVLITNPSVTNNANATKQLKIYVKTGI